MALAEILDLQLIDLDLHSTTKDEVLRDLSQHLLDAGYIDNLEQFVQDIYVREAEGITGMGNHIAIPHGKSKAVEKIGIAVGRCQNLIEWESYDEQPVNLIFLFCVSDDCEFARNHMMLLAELAGKLGNDERVEKLQMAKTKQDIIDLFIN